MALLQWLALAILLTIIGAFAYLYVRHGVKVKPDPERRHEDGVFTTQGLDASSTHGGGGSDGGNE
jgi:hypothetical protein